jgi:hypothetical protein
METYGHNGMIQSSVETSLKLQKAVMEMASQLQLAKLSSETLELIDWANRYKKGQINLKGEVKNSGRRSYLESDPKLVMKVRELRSKKLKNREISDKLFLMGWKTKTGNKFNTGMISKLYQQSNLLVKKTSG